MLISTTILCLMGWLAGNLEFILQVTIKLISLLNLVKFMEFSDSLANFSEF
jgi:type III secretory pathway component EscT